MKMKRSNGRIEVGGAGIHPPSLRSRSVPSVSSLCPLCYPALVAAMCLLASCAQGPNAALAGPEYPDRSQSKTLDIQVVRDETIIRLTNTTARGFGPSRLWVNRWYSKAVDKLDVGQSLELNLWDFRDQYGAPFQAGGFFATRKPEKLVLAQLATENEVFGLVVVGRGQD